MRVGSRAWAGALLLASACMPAGAGRGGRTPELALAAAISLAGHDGGLVASFATDAEDGPTPRPLQRLRRHEAPLRLHQRGIRCELQRAPNVGPVVVTGAEGDRPSVVVADGVDELVQLAEELAHEMRGEAGLQRRVHPGIEGRGAVRAAYGVGIAAAVDPPLPTEAEDGAGTAL